jgi:hypothetical protein
MSLKIIAMINSEAEIIKKRINKLDQEDFDLEAWKETTFSILQRILDTDDLRLKQINNLKVDYGSWALRDATSKYNPIETAKKKGKEVLESVLDDLALANPLDSLSETLSGSVLKKIAKSSKKEDLIKVLNKEKKENLVAALAALIPLYL